MRTCQRQINLNNRKRERKAKQLQRRMMQEKSLKLLLMQVHLRGSRCICVGCTCFDDTKIMKKSKQIDWHLRNFDQLSSANSTWSIAKTLTSIVQFYCIGSMKFWVDKSARSNKWKSLKKLMPPVAVCCHKSPELSNEANLIKIRFIYCEKMFKKK